MSMYQSEEDTKNEMRIADALALELGVSILMTPKGSSVDYIMHKDGAIVGIGECKARRGEYSYERMLEFGDVMLDASKVKSARMISKSLMVNFYFVVELTNRMLYFECDWRDDLKLKTKKIRLGKVRDLNDEDVVALFPISQFKVMQNDPETIPARRP